MHRHHVSFGSCPPLPLPHGRCRACAACVCCSCSAPGPPGPRSSAPASPAFRPASAAPRAAASRGFSVRSQTMCARCELDPDVTCVWTHEDRHPLFFHVDREQRTACHRSCHLSPLFQGTHRGDGTTKANCCPSVIRAAGQKCAPGQDAPCVLDGSLLPGPSLDRAPSPAPSAGLSPPAPVPCSAPETFKNGSLVRDSAFEMCAEFCKPIPMHCAMWAARLSNLSVGVA